MPVNDIQILSATNRTPELAAQLVSVWERSVRATHTFLSDAEIAEIEPFVPQAIEGVGELVVAERNGAPVGFMGVEAGRLEMLFLDPAVRGQGLGRRLLTYGIERLGVRELTVNEQNPNAVGFYEHMGFATYKRTDFDEEDRPYPLLYMRLQGRVPAAERSIAYRSVDESDLPALAEILRGLWHTDTPTEEYAALEALHDVLDCLSWSTFAIVAEVDGETAGICCANTGANRRNGSFERWGEQRDEVELRLQETDPVAAARYRAYLDASYVVNKGLIADAGITHEAEIVLLAIGPRARGLGIGRALITRAVERLRKAGAPGAFLFTDTDCNWGFYDHLGLKRAAEHWRSANDYEGLPEGMLLYRVPC